MSGGDESDQPLADSPEGEPMLGPVGPVGPVGEPVVDTALSARQPLVGAGPPGREPVVGAGPPGREPVVGTVPPARKPLVGTVPPARKPLVCALPRIEELSGYHSPQVDVAVRLNTNESPISPPAGALARLAQELPGMALNRYPDRAALELRGAIADLEGTTPARVFVANGSNEVLQTISVTYGGPTMVLTPTYAMHAQISRILGLEVIEVPRVSDFAVDPEATAAAMRERCPKVIFVCSPNNPTGTATPIAVLARLAEVAAEIGALVVVDEAYGQFAEQSAVSLVGEDSPVLVSRTFSKTWSMAGVRLGYLVAPEWAVESLFSAVLPYHLDAIKQRFGEIVLDYREAMERNVKDLVAQRSVIVEGLATLPVRQWASQANFVLFRPDAIDARVLWQALLDRSVLVRDCSTWPGLDNSLRVTVGTADENRAFLGALADSLSALAGGPELAGVTWSTVGRHTEPSA